MPILYNTVKLFSLFHFNEIYLLEWSRYLFKNTLIVWSSPLILYSCHYIIKYFAQESEHTASVCLPCKKCWMFHKITNFLCCSCESIVLLILVLLCLLVVNIYLCSLKTNKISSIGVAKSFNSSIALCNYIITICIRITSILKSEVLLKSGDTETNPGHKNSSATSSTTGT